MPPFVFIEGIGAFKHGFLFSALGYVENAVIVWKVPLPSATTSPDARLTTIANRTSFHLVSVNAWNRFARLSHKTSLVVSNSLKKRVHAIRVHGPFNPGDIKHYVTTVSALCTLNWPSASLDNKHLPRWGRSKDPKGYVLSCRIRTRVRFQINNTYEISRSWTSHGEKVRREEGKPLKATLVCFFAWLFVCTGVWLRSASLSTNHWNLIFLTGAIQKLSKILQVILNSIIYLFIR